MTKCRICKGDLIKIIDFGKISLVGEFIKKKQDNLKKFKISLNICKDCKHIQIAEILKQDLLFKNYIWETGISKTNINLIKNLIKSLKALGASNKSRILEIASNDGSFLKYVKKIFNSFIVGVDPAKNLYKINQKNKILTILGYFNFKLSKKIYKKFNLFDFIIARNVIAHVPNPNEIFKGASKLLNKKGIFIVEFPHLLNIYRYNQYDNIFHEHIGYHSLKSIIDLCNKYNLKVFNVQEIDSQGGSLRCYICNQDLQIRINRKVKKMQNKENKFNLFSIKNIKNLNFRISNHIDQMQKLLKKLKKEGKKISIYGASGKGQALMQFCKIDNSIVDFVYDKSKFKQNCFTPGSQIKIKDPSEIKNKKIDILLLLSWNLKKEIISQEKKFIKEGGKFVIPFPYPRIVDK